MIKSKLITFEFIEGIFVLATLAFKTFKDSIVKCCDDTSNRSKAAGYSY